MTAFVYLLNFAKNNWKSCCRMKQTSINEMRHLFCSSISPRAWNHQCVCLNSLEAAACSFSIMFVVTNLLTRGTRYWHTVSLAYWLGWLGSDTSSIYTGAHRFTLLYYVFATPNNHESKSPQHWRRSRLWKTQSVLFTYTLKFLQHTADQANF